ncbi:MAG: TlpA family protein disulfide reductase [Gammaproteobacteria bacterium]|nr:TlpA family protein disulfide reductase [Gammaproteobacteria bacterium]MBT8152019.1 TlpA family protein disulfide reductase [Gammaproteobacteria bacterium]NND38544.1 TlpA family protein disulfide reductase [Pseudomonadales bacterium]NNM12513.1 TlpA family protein disulfide reductase [Pseudomonadales bacterium]RZV59543.1 MAG: TlpA family protein disulfide reductase [Pseudomonadales bacterium]
MSIKTLFKHASSVVCAGLLSVSIQLHAGSGDNEAPDFTLKSNSGENLRLAEQRGDVVLLNFWASWCGPCRQEMPHLNELQARYEALGLKVYGVNVDESSAEAERAIKSLKIAFPVLFDNSNTVAKLFDIDAMPTTVIIDKNGNMRYLHRGYKSGYENTYDKQVVSLIRE